MPAGNTSTHFRLTFHYHTPENVKKPQMTGFFMKCNNGLKWVNVLYVLIIKTLESCHLPHKFPWKAIYIMTIIHYHNHNNTITILISWEIAQKLERIRVALTMLLLLDHSFSAFAKFSEKLKFLITSYAHVHVRIRG